MKRKAYWLVNFHDEDTAPLAELEPVFGRPVLLDRSPVLSCLSVCTCT